MKRGILGAGGIRVFGFVGPHETLGASDQRNFWSRGIPAGIVTDTAFLRNPRVLDGVFNAALR